MPELPEVETICRYLKKILINQKILSVEVNTEKLRRPVPSFLHSLLQEKIIIDIYRRAKYIIIMLDNNLHLIIHLGMTGKLLYNSSTRKHDHVIFYLNDDQRLVFNDPRRFGSIEILTNIKDFFAKLGPEPLDENCNGIFLYKQLQKRTMSIKNALLNSAIIAGIGNIYASEILFAAKISPLKPANLLSEQDCDTLMIAIKEVLSKAITAGGTTLQDYRTPYNTKGYFQNELQVYQRQNCSYCHNPIICIKQAGRSTFYCKRCQEA